MDPTFIRKKKIGKLKDPVLIVGLPGVGLIGKVSVEYIISELKAMKMAEIYSRFFPHQVVMTKRGLLKPFMNTLHLYSGEKRDLLMLTGEVQPLTPEGQNLYANSILDHVKKMGCKLAISIGGYINPKVGTKRRVMGLVSNLSLKEELENLGVVFGKAKGSIVGQAGLIPAFTRMKRMKGICLLGETLGPYIDPGSARNVVSILSKYLDFDINLEGLDKMAKDAEKAIKRIEKEIKESLKRKSPDEGDLSYIR